MRNHQDGPLALEFIEQGKHLGSSRVRKLRSRFVHHQQRWLGQPFAQDGDHPSFVGRQVGNASVELSCDGAQASGLKCLNEMGVLLQSAEQAALWPQAN